MEDCHSLLGIHPTAGSDEIEEAYRNKLREHDPKRFAEGSPERENAIDMQKRLDQAYNDAIMASFAPIRAFAVQNSSPEELHRQPQARPTPPRPAPSPRDSAPLPAGVQAAPVRSSWTPPPHRDPELEGLVEEVPVSFSDEDLLKMDISQLRETYAAPQRERSWLPTLGIEDPLLRSYVWMFLSFTLLDFLMRLVMGNAWSGVNGMLGQATSLLSGSLAAQTNAPPPPPPSAVWSLLTSVVSMVYLFVCSLIMPIVVRFFLLGEPVTDKKMMRFMLDLTSIAAAYVVMMPLGLIFRILPPEWAGSSLNLIFVTPLLCDVTLRYGGRP